MRKFDASLTIDIDLKVWGESAEAVKEVLDDASINELLATNSIDFDVTENPKMPPEEIADGIIHGERWSGGKTFEDERGHLCTPSDLMADYPEEKRGSAEHQAILEAQGQMRLFAEPEKSLIPQGDTEEEG